MGSGDGENLHLANAIKHWVAFRFKDDVSESDVRAILDGFADFPRRYPAMHNWSMGLNVSDRDQTYTHAFSVEFDTEEGFRAFLSDEYHLTFVRERFRPAISTRAIVSYYF